MSAVIKSISVKMFNFSYYIEEFTENTYIMLVFSDSHICNKNFEGFLCLKFCYSACRC